MEINKCDYNDNYRKKITLFKKIKWFIPHSKHHYKGLRFAKEFIKKSNKIIDIGSSEGKFLYLCKKINPKAELVGIEPHQEYSSYAVSWLGIKTINSFVEEVEYIEADLVCLLEVIEHIKDPEILLKRIKAKYLFISCPLDNEINRYHIHSFSFESIKHLLKETGWKIIKVDYRECKSNKIYLICRR